MEVMGMERIYVGIDSENIFGDVRHEGFDLSRTVEATVEVLRRIARRGLILGGVAIGDEDLQAKTAFALAAAGIRSHARMTSGPDAADLELLSYLEFGLPRSATTLVLASGDGIFSGLVTRLRRGGLHVDIVAVPGTLSHRLYRSADHYIPLDIEH